MSSIAKEAEQLPATLLGKLKAQSPLSTISAIAYLLVGIALERIQPSMSSLMLQWMLILLTAGTLVFHLKLTKGHQRMDHAGMAGVYVALPALMVHAWWWMALGGSLAAIAVLVYNKTTEVNDQLLMAVCAFFALCVAAGRGRSDLRVALLGVAGFGLLGLGFWFWRRKGKGWKASDATPGQGDFYHMLWHLCTAAGTLLLALTAGL